MIRRLREHAARVFWGETRDPLVAYWWYEPYSFTRTLRRLGTEEEWRLGRIIKSILVGTILLILPLFLAVAIPLRPGPDRQPLPRLLPWSYVLGLVLLASFALSSLNVGLNYLVYLFGPRSINLRKKMIVCGQGNSNQRWSYEQIASIQFKTMRFGNREFTVMFIGLRDGKDVALGVSKRADLPRVINLLNSRGVQIAEPSGTA